MLSNKLKGLMYGLISGSTFGLIPLFSLSVMKKGMPYESVLFYRFTFAALIVGALALKSGKKFNIDARQIPILLLLGIFYAASSMFLLWGYTFMSSGTATTIHFLYPVFVTILMFLFFKERISFLKFIAILVSIVGVYLLSKGESDEVSNVMGVVIVVISAVAYALYIVTVNNFTKTKLTAQQLTFIILSFCAIIFFIRAAATDALVSITSGLDLLNLVLLGFIPTVVSNISLVHSIKYLGSTPTAVLGALEPLTAVTTGILIFHEPLSAGLIIGGILVIISVIIIVTAKK